MEDNAKDFARQHAIDLMSRLDVMRANGMKDTDEYKQLEQVLNQTINQLNEK